MKDNAWSESPQTTSCFRSKNFNVWIHLKQLFLKTTYPNTWIISSSNHLQACCSQEPTSRHSVLKSWHNFKHFKCRSIFKPLSVQVVINEWNPFRKFFFLSIWLNYATYSLEVGTSFENILFACHPYQRQHSERDPYRSGDNTLKWSIGSREHEQFLCY